MVDLPSEAKPLTFGPEMVRAILAGRKTQTRRLFTPGNAKVGGRMGTTAPDLWRMLDWTRADRARAAGMPDALSVPRRTPGFAETLTPRWTVGERLHLREAVAPDGAGGWRYAADIVALPPGAQHWRKPRYMPRAAARAMLTVEAVRVERVQDITLGDICAEGLARSIYDFKPAQRGFDAWIALWNSLHGAGAWEANPWVAVLTFKVERRQP